MISSTKQRVTYPYQNQFFTSLLESSYNVFLKKNIEVLNLFELAKFNKKTKSLKIQKPKTLYLSMGQSELRVRKN